MEQFKIIGQHWLFERKDRKRSRYGVGFRVEGGSMVKRTFQTKEARKEFMRSVKLGEDLATFSAVEWKRWCDLKAYCATRGFEPEDAARNWAQIAPSAPEKTLAEAVKEFLVAKEGTSDAYQKHIALLLRDRLVSALPEDTQVSAITRAWIEPWLLGLSSNPETHRNHRAQLRTFFGWAKRRGYISNSPMSGIEVLPAGTREPGILTVAETTALFSANKHDPEVCALLALGAFAGIRTSGIDRLESDEIRLRDKQIFFPASKFKTRRAHLIEHAPDNLWDWLKRADLKKMCAMTARNKAYARESAYVKAGLLVTKATADASDGKLKPKAPPHNCLRHSFATYKCAIDGGAERASFILGHRNPAEIWQSYKGIATTADAERYFKIVP